MARAHPGNELAAEGRAANLKRSTDERDSPGVERRSLRFRGLVARGVEDDCLKIQSLDGGLIISLTASTAASFENT